MELFHDSIVYYGTHAPSQRGVGVLHRTPRYHCPEQELPHKHKIERESRTLLLLLPQVSLCTYIYMYVHVVEEGCWMHNITCILYLFI